MSVAVWPAPLVRATSSLTAGNLGQDLKAHDLKAGGRESWLGGGRCLISCRLVSADSSGSEWRVESGEWRVESGEER